MHSYIAPSINRNANVLSPTKHWSCDSRYATAGSGERAVQISATRDGVQLKSGSAASADHLSGGPIESLRLNPKPPCHTGRHAPVWPLTSSAMVVTASPLGPSRSMWLASMR